MKLLVIKRKQAVIISMAVLIAVAGYLNWSYGGEETPEEITVDKPLGTVSLVSEDEDEFMAQARLDREISRSKAVETLQSIASSSESDLANKELAEAEVIKMAKLADDENTIESLIRAKGFEDAVIYISDGKVSAIIKTQTLDAEAVAKVVDIISEQTGIEASNIKVMQSPQ